MRIQRKDKLKNYGNCIKQNLNKNKMKMKKNRPPKRQSIKQTNKN